jgi:hypothetical protein
MPSYFQNGDRPGERTLPNSPSLMDALRTYGELRDRAGPVVQLLMGLPSKEEWGRMSLSEQGRAMIEVMGPTGVTRASKTIPGLLRSVANDNPGPRVLAKKQAQPYGFEQVRFHPYANEPPAQRFRENDNYSKEYSGRQRALETWRYLPGIEALRKNYGLSLDRAKELSGYIRALSEQRPRGSVMEVMIDKKRSVNVINDTPNMLIYNPPPPKLVE